MQWFMWGVQVGANTFPYHQEGKFMYSLIAVNDYSEPYQSKVWTYLLVKGFFFCIFNIFCIVVQNWRHEMKWSYEIEKVSRSIAISSHHLKFSLWWKSLMLLWQNVLRLIAFPEWAIILTTPPHFHNPSGKRSTPSFNSKVLHFRI